MWQKRDNLTAGITIVLLKMKQLTIGEYHFQDAKSFEKGDTDGGVSLLKKSSS